MTMTPIEFLYNNHITEPQKLVYDTGFTYVSVGQ